MALNRKLNGTALSFVMGILAGSTPSHFIYGAQKNIPYNGQNKTQAKTPGAATELPRNSSDGLDTYNLNHSGMSNMGCWLWKAGDGYQILAQNDNGQITISEHFNYKERHRREDYDSLYAARAAFKRFKDAKICDADSTSETVWTVELFDQEKDKQQASAYKQKLAKEAAKQKDVTDREAAKQRDRDEALKRANNQQPKQW